jgi:hypothetical protein
LLEVEVDLVSTTGAVFPHAKVFASSASATAVPAWYRNDRPSMATPLATHGY